MTIAINLEQRLSQLSVDNDASASHDAIISAAENLFDNDFTADDLDQAAASLGLRHGLEKESLRTTKQGQVAQTAHPTSLGASLTCPYITTDFSEGLLELITAPHKSTSALFNELFSLHQFSAQNISDEILWAASMPPEIIDPLQIQIANFGSSPMGMMKRIYREGLAMRYGKLMQVISGVHFNFSVSDNLLKQISALTGEDKSAIYLSQVRQILRDMWILPYLFGTSPAAARTSVSGPLPTFLQKHAKRTVLATDATSLRSGDLGYRNKGAELLAIDYSTTSGYANSLYAATQNTYPPYAELNSQHIAYRQLNDHLLQIENEYYIPVRPKQIANSGELPSCALASRGIEYVELRALDVDPFAPLGIAPKTLAFLDVFMLTSLITPSDNFALGELAAAQANLSNVATYGLQPGLMLDKHGKKISFADHAAELFSRLKTVAAWMDEHHQQNNLYTKVVEDEYKKCSDIYLTPAKRIIETLLSGELDYDSWVLKQSQQHHEMLLKSKTDGALNKKWQQMVEDSLQEYELLQSDSKT